VQISPAILNYINGKRDETDAAHYRVVYRFVQSGTQKSTVWTASVRIANDALHTIRTIYGSSVEAWIEAQIAQEA
jgi:hypothetical protein